jgi:hypothetical protein
MESNASTYNAVFRVTFSINKSTKTGANIIVNAPKRVCCSVWIDPFRCRAAIAAVLRLPYVLPFDSWKTMRIESSRYR